MFARFNENPAMTLQDMKETKRYGRTDGRTDTRTDARTDGQRENSIPPTNKVCGGYNYCLMQVKSIAETFTKLPIIIKILVLPIFEWPFYTGFTVHSHITKLTKRE